MVRARHIHTPIPMPAQPNCRKCPLSAFTVWLNPRFEPVALRDIGGLPFTHYFVVQPPSTMRTAPVMNVESSPARKSAALATSVGNPKRGMGVWARE